MTERGAGLQGEFSLDPRCVHLNHGSYGAVPRVVAEVRRRLLAEAEANPNRWFRFTLGERFEEAREIAAEFVGAPAERFAFVPNTTAGINAALSSLRLGPGDEVLLTDHVYPAVAMAARRVCARAGARVVIAGVGTTTGVAVVAAVEAALTPRTVAAVVDHIASPTGMVLPVADIVAALARRGVVSIVDAAHAPGQVPVDTAALGADVWVGNFHKWLGAPPGAAGLVVSDGWRDRIEPLVASVNVDDGFPASFGWMGTLDYTPYLCVPAAVDFLAALGGDTVGDYGRDLAARARDLFGTDPVVPPAAASTMTVVPLPEGWAATLERARDLIRAAEDDLAAELCFLPWGDRGYLRLSAWAYNSLDEYERIANQLPAFLNGQDNGVGGTGRR